MEVVGQRTVQREVAAQAEVSGETAQQLGHMLLLQGLWGRRGRARKDRAVEEEGQHKRQETKGFRLGRRKRRRTEVPYRHEIRGRDGGEVWCVCVRRSRQQLILAAKQPKTRKSSESSQALICNKVIKQSLEQNKNNMLLFCSISEKNLHPIKENPQRSKNKRTGRIQSPNEAPSTDTELSPLPLHKAGAGALGLSQSLVPAAVHHRDGATATEDVSSCVPAVNDTGRETRGEVTVPNMSVQVRPQPQKSTHIQYSSAIGPVLHETHKQQSRANVEALLDPQFSNREHIEKHM